MQTVPRSNGPERTGTRRAPAGLAALAVGCALFAAHARAAEPTSRELLDRTRQLNETTRKWTDRTQKMKLTIVDRRGGERQRDLVVYYKKYPEERNRTLLFFESPPDVKGVGFLQWADPHAKDDQWLYLPELKRPPRQISGGAKRESFAGTDFSYDDLTIIGQITDWTEADAHTQLLRTEDIDGMKAYVIEFTPAGKELSYGRVVAWLTADDLVLRKFEMYDKSDRLEKVLTLGDIRKIGEIPTAFRSEMKNVQTGSHTAVEMLDVTYDTNLDDGMFTQRALEHGPS
jgi:outer membrane lipoprotein-sorting protein